MDPAPRGLGIPVVTLLLEVNEYKYLNADVSWNIFLCLFFGQWWSSDFVSRVGRMPSLRWKTTLPQANHVWWSRWANKFSIKMSLPIFNQIFDQSVPGKQAGKSFCTSPPRARAGRQTSLLMHIGTQLATRPQGFGVWSRFGSGVSKSQIWSTKKSQGNVERIEEMLMWSFNDRLQGKVGKSKKVKNKNIIVKKKVGKLKKDKN